MGIFLCTRAPEEILLSKANVQNDAKKQIRI